MLQSQLEVATAPHTSIADARTELRFLRQTVANIAADHGLAILAVGTHPTATWRTSVQTPAERYDHVMEDLQMIGQRNMLCGLHVHVELPDPDDRVDIMMRIDRKSTRLNSSHDQISYAVFCLKKKNKNKINIAICLEDL